MEEKTCKTLVTGVGSSNVMSNLIFSFWYGNLGLTFDRQKKALGHYYESAKDTLRMAGNEKIWFGTASRTAQSSWHKHLLLGQKQGSGQQPAAGGRARFQVPWVKEKAT